MDRKTFDDLYRTLPAYADGHCAGFNGWPYRKPADELATQAYDRGFWQGRKRREAAIAAPRHLLRRLKGG